ncbi:MAG: hypothetical protein ACFB21_03635 [Opitutales bacterium]
MFSFRSLLFCLAVIVAISPEAFGQRRAAPQASSSETRSTNQPVDQPSANASEGGQRRTTVPVRSAADPTPEELFAEAMDGVLSGYHFNKRLATENPLERVVLLESDDDAVVVVWTEDYGDRIVPVPLTQGTIEVVRYNGESLGREVFPRTPVNVPVTREPTIYRPTKSDPMLQMALATRKVPALQRVRGPDESTLTIDLPNVSKQVVTVTDLEGREYQVPAGETLRVRRQVVYGRRPEPYRRLVGVVGIAQEVDLQPVNPLFLELWPQGANTFRLDVINTGGDPIRGRFEVDLVRAGGASGEPFTFPFNMAAGQELVSLKLPTEANVELDSALQLRLLSRLPSDPQRVVIISATPALRFARAADFTRIDERGGLRDYSVKEPDGVVAILSTGVPRDEPLPVPSRSAAVLVYDFANAEAEAKAGISPLAEIPQARAIIAKPDALGVWIYGDGSGNRIFPEVRDGSGKIHQLSPMKLDWSGWRYQQFSFADDLLPPLQWESMMTVEQSPTGTRRGAVFINHPMLAYRFDL